ncbi:MAG: hypothetical protein M3179_03665 [Actinomycetota bacterium]|nr:hypothetical protein [Actinomycetota bacterium]
MVGEAGIVGANLVIVLAFALYAVIQLSRTTLAANQIRDRVDVIESTVEPIQDDLTNVPKLDDTDRVANEILAAVQGLNDQAQVVVATARSIDGTVTSIRSNAESINSSVRSIKGTSGTLTPVVRSINDGAATINRQADRGIELVRAIQGDTANVLNQVGGPGPGGHSSAGGKGIHGHANSINCSSAFAPNANCER